MGRIAWAPILDGALRARALAAVAETVARVRAQRGVTPSVAHGLSGFALLLLEANRVQPRLASTRDVESMLARSVRLVAEVPLGSGLYEGYPGVGLTLELARRAGFRGVAGLDEIDRALLGWVERFGAVPPAYAHLDLITGLAGQAIYACARLPRIRARRALERLISWLGQRAVVVGGGASWLSPPRASPGPDMLAGNIVDLGLAHGVPGILAVLARILEAGIAPRASRRLLQRGTHWLLGQYQVRDGSAFDAYVANPADRPATDAATARTGAARLAWCYGDPGIACALISCAHALGDRRLHATAQTMVRRIAALRDDPSVQDASLCHGTAGLLHILHRLYLATGEPRARDAAIYWAERTLEVRAGPRAMGPDDSGPASPYRPLRFLAGAAGSALALLAAASSTAPLWDSIMLLDLPTMGSRAAGRRTTRAHASAPAPRRPRRAIRDS